MQVRYLFSLLAILLSMSISVADYHESEIVSLQKEIGEYETKIEELRNRINHTENKAKSDSSAYEVYINDHRDLYNRMQAERDSLSAITKSLIDKQKALEIDQEKIKIQGDNFSSLSTGLMRKFKLDCDMLLDSLQSLQIFNMGRQISALEFLRGEIATETIDPVEGLERYYQITRQINEKSGQVETWIAPSPVSSFGGDVAYLRLGFIWLACINNDDTAGFFWDSDEHKWLNITDTADLLHIRKAINLAAGKTAPQLISLPFDRSFTIEKQGDSQ